uniref:NADH-ubiquinone oxidoreductase chain 5 n=1 Tax=Hyalella sp. 2015-x TaxID=2742071 RepID=A0A7T8V7E4_9CRUS|nr:NADH dehydrogenase subunit 5 [Hyalella sp. 2015-x]
MGLMNNIYKIFSLLTGLVMIITLMVSFMFIYKEMTIILDWEIMILNSSLVTMSIIIDWMSLIFLSTVMLITASICMFSSYYMKEEINSTRFMMLLMLFVGSMVCLIISPNMISLLLGWDGLGLTSYILVIYYQNESSYNAGTLTVLSNRIGDVCILMAICILSYSGSWNFYSMDTAQYKMIYLFVVVAAMTKSAQIPFSAWLPAAMAAPTPVSALVHSSTLVTAGVYLLIRFFHILEKSVFLQILLVISVMTMMMAGWGANFETDLKKIVALSTLSQLGLMMMILSLGMKNIAFFHMISHAMFKSTLFMATGVMIHMSNSAQDSRLMGAMNTSSPTLMVMFSMMNLSLLGFPFLSGFFSKDLSLEYSLSTVYNNFILLLIVLATGMTVSYSMRVIFLAVTNSANTKSVYNLEDSDTTVVNSMLMLFFMGGLTGYLFSWTVMWTPHTLLMTNLSKYYILSIMFISGLIMLLLLTKQKFVKLPYTLSLLTFSSSKMWNMPFLSTKNLNKFILTVGSSSSHLMDKGWLELYPPKKMTIIFTYYSYIIKKSQSTSLISAYLISSILIMMFIIFW